MKFLIVVDMQNDFISGSLGSDAAKKIVPKVSELAANFCGTVIFTRDTHTNDYLNTREGKYLPVIHCVKNTHGWEICSELSDTAVNIIDKPSFGSMELPELIRSFGEPDEILLCGLCTDICVISNAMILKAAFPEADISADASCCAGVTAESHKNALNAMKSVQINIINE